MALGPCRAKAAALTALLCCLPVAPGCASFRARQTFNATTLGRPWADASGAERYAMNGQLAFYSIDGPGDQEGSDYFVVVSDGGNAVAKAYSIKGHPSAFGLQIEARYWQELREVASHYPYYDAPAGGVGFFRPRYGPLRDPESPGDKLLPSGVRQSTWAMLVDFLWGWPFASAHERWTAETQVCWHGARADWPDVTAAPERLPAESVITVFWNKGPLAH